MKYLILLTLVFAFMVHAEEEKKDGKQPKSYCSKTSEDDVKDVSCDSIKDAKAKAACEAKKVKGSAKKDVQ